MPLQGSGNSYGPAKSGSELRLRRLEETISETGESFSRVASQTHTPDWGMDPTLCDALLNSPRDDNQSAKYALAPTIPSQVNLLTAESRQETDTLEAPPAAEDNDRTRTAVYSNNNGVVGGDQYFSFLLSKKTIDQLKQIAIAKRIFNRYRSRYQEAKREADIGQSFIDHATSEMHNSALPDYIRTEIRQDLERRKPAILAKIQWKMEIKQKLQKKRIHLERLRDESDDAFELMVNEIGIFVDPNDIADEQSCEREPRRELASPKSSSDSSALKNNFNTSRPATDSQTIPADVNIAEEEKSENHTARQEHVYAFHNLRVARQEFDERGAVYNFDVTRHAGSARFSREHINLFHLQRGRELSKNLRKAEEEFERTQARAEALGMQIWSDTSSRTRIVYDDDNDGYRESQDPAYAGIMDRARIQMWVETVGALEEPHRPSTPIIERDAEPVHKLKSGSVHISDSCSVLDDDPKQRRRIDRWQEHQESLRKIRLGVSA